MILLSSDVSARGMDYPDVSFVLQVGMTARDQYIHRYEPTLCIAIIHDTDALTAGILSTLFCSLSLGRTARAGKEGCGLLLLAPFEHRSMLEELEDMPLQEIPPSLNPSPLVSVSVVMVLVYVVVM